MPNRNILFNINYENMGKFSAEVEVFYHSVIKVF